MPRGPAPLKGPHCGRMVAKSVFGGFVGGAYVDTAHRKVAVTGAERLDERYAAVAVGKAKSGRELDGRTWDEMPCGLPARPSPQENCSQQR